MAINIHWMHRNHWENTQDGMAEMAKTLEDANITSVLLPYGPTGTDFLLHVPEIFALTKNLKVMVALPAYGLTPEYALRIFDTMQRYGRDRLDLNLVAGNYNEDNERYVLNSYPGDLSIIDSHEKRVKLTENWMNKFVDLLKTQNFQTTLYVVGSSDTTINVANNYTDYIIIHTDLLNDEFLSKIKNTKILLLIDPLIIEDPKDLESIEYQEYTYTKDSKHPMQGTEEEVINMIKDISNKFKINDFLIHTDQKDISSLIKLSKSITSTNF